MITIVEFLQFADQVLTLPGDGTILSESGDDAANKHNSEGSVRDSTQDSNEHFHGVYSATPAIVEASESDNDTRLRSEGDVALYGYYMKSVSVWVLLTWLFVTAIVAVMERMPGKENPSLVLSNNANSVCSRHLCSYLG